jgi:hypothetical protein
VWRYIAKINVYEKAREGAVPATDLQVNVSARRFKRRSRAAVVMGFVVARSAEIGMSKLHSTTSTLIYNLALLGSMNND